MNPPIAPPTPRSSPACTCPTWGMRYTTAAGTPAAPATTTPPGPGPG